MGLLDDAIREHLELKRKHGADPGEVARQEQEALGAPRRNEFAQPGGAAEAGAAADAPPPGDLVDGPDAGPEDDVAAVAAGDRVPDEPDALPEGEPGVPEEPAAREPASAPGYDEDPWLDEEDPPEVEARAAEGEEPRAEEDVLEETPEFLQETPEHDRLWFEQKPPRDFDWDR